MMSTSALPTSQRTAGDISGSEFLSVFLGSDPSEEHLNRDINKKEAPRILPQFERLTMLSDDVISDSLTEEQTPINRNSRSNKNEIVNMDSDKNGLMEKADGDDLHAESSSYYRDNIAGNEPAKNDFASNAYGHLHSLDESPKIIGVRVTSSVAVGRGNKNEPSVLNYQNPIIAGGPETARKIKSGSSHNGYPNDSPTTWRPPHFRFINRDYYRGVPSNRHSVSTLPGPLLGANEDYIQQQKERELNRKKQENLHPYQRAIIYNNEPKEGQKPRSFSYSSVINTYGDTKLTTAGDWSSTRAETAATEASAGFVTIIDHGEDNSVEVVKDQTERQTEIKESYDVNANKPAISPPIVPNVPHVYSEPAKVYSEPAKIYGEPSKVYGKPEQIYSEPAKVYSEPSKVYGVPSKFYSEPSKVYGEPSKVYSEPAKVYSQPSVTYKSDGTPSVPQTPANQEQNFSEADNYARAKQMTNSGDRSSAAPVSDPRAARVPSGRGRGNGEQNYEVDESVSVMTNGRTHGVQDKAQDDGQKVGYVVEGRNFRKYRVEERTSDGFIVGEYGVVSHDDGSLRGVRYTADGTTNPRLIYDALMKFLSL